MSFIYEKIPHEDEDNNGDINGYDDGNNYDDNDVHDNDDKDVRQQ